MDFHISAVRTSFRKCKLTLFLKHCARGADIRAGGILKRTTVLELYGSYLSLVSQARLPRESLARETNLSLEESYF